MKQTKLQTCELAQSILANAKITPGNHGAFAGPIDVDNCEECGIELRWRLLAACNLLPEPELPRTDMIPGDSKCISYLIQNYSDTWLPEESERLKAIIVLDISDRGAEIEKRRMYRIVDAMIREFLPVAAEAFDMQPFADSLRNLAPIVDEPSADLAGLAGLADLAGLARLADLADLADLAGLARLVDLARLADLAGLARLADLADLARLVDLARLADLADLARLADLVGLVGLARLADLAGLVGLARLADLAGLVGLVEKRKPGIDRAIALLVELIEMGESE